MKIARYPLPVAVGAITTILFGCGYAAANEPVPTYLPIAEFDVVPALQPAPVRGEVRYEADREIFRRTRALKGTPRWALATRDASEKPADMMRDFSCAAGAELSPDREPALARILATASADTARINNVAKNDFHRARPFTIDPGPICQPARDVLNSFDYPSGHTTRGWTWALVLAKVLPERASAILARGRAYGESRVVCGVPTPAPWRPDGCLRVPQWLLFRRLRASEAISSLQGESSTIASRLAGKRLRSVCATRRFCCLR